MAASGDVIVDAADASGVFANVTLVTSASSTNDGGFSIIRGAIKDSRPVDYVSSQAGLRLIKFGDTVRVAAIEEDYSSADGEIEEGGVPRATSCASRTATPTRGSTPMRASASSCTAMSSRCSRATRTAATRAPTGTSATAPAATSAPRTTPTPTCGLLIAGDGGRAYQYVGITPFEGDLGLVDYSDLTLWLALGGDEGEIYEWMGPDTEMDLTAPDHAYDDLGWWKPVPVNGILPDGLNISGSEAIAYGGLVVLNDVRASAVARIDHVQVDADGDVIVQAHEEALLRATADGSIVSSGGASFPEMEGDSIARGGVIATNVVLSEAIAKIVDSHVVAGGDVLVGAENVAQLDAVTKVYIESAQENEGIALAFNSIGWKSQNLLFNLIDAIIGDPLVGEPMGGQQPAKVEALIERTDVDAGGDVAVVAVNAAVINAELSNESKAVVVMVWGSAAKSMGFGVAKNMVNANTTAAVRGTVASPVSVTAGGAITVSADEVAEIVADSTVEVLSQAVNDPTLLFTGIFEDAVQDYGYTSNSGTTVAIKTGALVRVADDYSIEAAQGNIYAFLGGRRHRQPHDGDLHERHPLAPARDRGRRGGDRLAHLAHPEGRLAVDERAGRRGPRRRQRRARRREGRGHRRRTGRPGRRRDPDGDRARRDHGDGHEHRQGRGRPGRHGWRRRRHARRDSWRGGGRRRLPLSRDQHRDRHQHRALERDCRGHPLHGAADGDIVVRAQNLSFIDAEVTNATATTGIGVGVTLAFNTVGWDSQNIIFNIAEVFAGAIIGTEKPAETTADVTGSTLTAGGGIEVSAANSAHIDAHVSSSVVTVTVSLEDEATSVAIDPVIAMNKVSTKTLARIQDAETGDDTIPAISAAGGDLVVRADDLTWIRAFVEAPVTAVAVSLNAEEKTISVGVALSVTRNDIQTETDAELIDVEWARASGKVTVAATGSSTIDATATASAITVAVSLKEGTAVSGGGAVAINMIAGRTNATIERSRVTAPGLLQPISVTPPLCGIELSTVYDAVIDATVRALAVAVAVSGSGTTPAVAIGISVARNLIGWQQFGNPTAFDNSHTSEPVEVKARAIDSTLEAIGSASDVVISAETNSTITAIVEATSVAVAVSTDTAVAVSIGGVWTDNMIGARVEASATRTAISAGRAFRGHRLRHVLDHRRRTGRGRLGRPHRAVRAAPAPWASRSRTTTSTCRCGRSSRMPAPSPLPAASSSRLPATATSSCSRSPWESRWRSPAARPRSRSPAGDRSRPTASCRRRARSSKAGRSATVTPRPSARSR